MSEPEQETLPGVAGDETSETLDLDTLESHLWEAADILRGSIDAADYKNYIFGLLFLVIPHKDLIHRHQETRQRTHSHPEIVLPFSF